MKIIYFLAVLFIKVSSQKVKYLPENDVILMDGYSYKPIKIQFENLNQQESIDLDHTEQEEDEYIEQEGQSSLFKDSLIIVVLLTLGGLFAGLTIGYISMDHLELELKAKNGTDEEKKAAAIILPIINQRHFLLSTLLIAQGLVLESLPIFMERIFVGHVAILICTILVVIFGEILPQAICIGPKQMQIASSMAPVLKTLMFLLCILSYPMGLFLDWLLGKHGHTRFRRGDLKALMELHKVSKEELIKRQQQGEEGGGITQEQLQLISSTIDLREQTVENIMIKMDQVFMISNKEIITQQLVNTVKAKGYSKILVFEEQNKTKIIGYFKAKQIISYTPKMNSSTIEQLVNLQQPLLVVRDTSLLEVLMIIQQSKSNLVLVTSCTSHENSSRQQKFIKQSNSHLILNTFQDKPIGIFVLKDIFEVLLQKELKDDDIHQNVEYSAQFAQKNKMQLFSEGRFLRTNKRSGAQQELGEAVELMEK